MQYLFETRLKILLFAVLFIAPSYLAASEGEYKLLEQLTFYNLPSPSEPARSHFPGRIYLSTSAGSVHLPQYKEFGNLPETFSSKDVAKQQISLTSGVYYPLDASISFSRFATSLAHPPYQLSSYLQWTFFEKLAYPTIASRIQWSRLYQLKGIDLKSFASSLDLSWGYRQLTVFSGLSAHFHKARLSSKLSDATSEKKDTTHSFINHSFSWGMQLQLVPGFLAISTEVLQSSRSRQYQSKIRVEF